VTGWRFARHEAHEATKTTKRLAFGLWLPRHLGKIAFSLIF